MFTVPELPYDYDALEPYLSKEILHYHHDKHHVNYCNQLNEALALVPGWKDQPIEEILSNLTDLPENIRTKVQNNGGGYYSHNLFFSILTPNQTTMSLELKEALESTFESIEHFKELFSTAAKDVFGSGWAWLVIDTGQLKIEKTQNQDTPFMKGQTPIMVIDVWEHAYYLQYQNRRPDFIQAFWNIINWEEVSNLYKKALK